MAVDLRWLDQAKDDIQSILAYILFDSPKAANAYVGGGTLPLSFATTNFTENRRR